MSMHISMYRLLMHAARDMDRDLLSVAFLICKQRPKLYNRVEQEWEDSSKGVTQTDLDREVSLLQEGRCVAGLQRQQSVQEHVRQRFRELLNPRHMALGFAMSREFKAALKLSAELKGSPVVDEERVVRSSPASTFACRCLCQASPARVADNLPSL